MYAIKKQAEIGKLCVLNVAFKNALKISITSLNLFSDATAYSDNNLAILQ
jgi:hypothetical protein